MQIKSTMRYLTLVKVDIIKKTRNKKCWQGCREKGTLVYCWWDVFTMENSMEIPQKIKNGNLLKENKNTDSKRYMHPNVYCNIVLNSQDMEVT